MTIGRLPVLRPGKFLNLLPEGLAGVSKPAYPIRPQAEDTLALYAWLDLGWDNNKSELAPVQLG